ncbi:MAG: thiamine-phosphate kinase [Gemmataceae bacterium]
MNTGEFAFIRWLRERTPGGPRVIVGPGDDTAVLAPASRPLLVTTDMLMDGTDFILKDVGGLAAGRKAMAANLSDIAAMAGVPIAVVVSVALPKHGGRELAEELHRGLSQIANDYDVSIVGGDTNTWDHPLAISVTMLGEATERGPVLRSGAKPGDWLFVTGPLGGSILGKHLTFTPRVREALAIHEAAPIHAMIDISDGLAADLQHILEESGCGANLDAAAIPISDDAVKVSRTSGRTPLQHALGDGEDFELLFAVDPADGPKFAHFAKIGECVESGLMLNGEPLAPTGWVHAMETRS